MQQSKLSFIGAGNMANSLINGLIKQSYPSTLITASDPDAQKLQALHNETNIHITTNNQQAVELADVIILAVKPQIIRPLSTTISSAVTTRTQPPLIISIAAGVSIDQLTSCFSSTLPIVRAMPNTPALIQQGMTGLFANPNVSEQQKQMTEQVFSAVGHIAWLHNEAQMNAVTAISGSGPAYFFLVMEALEQAAINLQLPKELANTLVIQTALGAATLAQEKSMKKTSLSTLRKQVTSPGGTTEAALNVLEQQHIRDIFNTAIRAANQRANELEKPD